MRTRAALLVAGVVVVLGTPAARADDRGAGAATLAAATERVQAASAAVSDLERQAQQIASEVTASESTVSAVTAQVSDDQRAASELVAAAKRQVIAGYVRGSGGNEAGVVAALARANGNDAAWSLGVLRIANKRTLGLALEASHRQGASSGLLVDALAKRDQVLQRLTGLSDQLTRARSDLRVAETELGRTIVTKVAPATIEGMTTVAYDAYRRSAAALAVERPACGLRWELLAAIGRTESNHGMGRLGPDGGTRPKIVGVPIGADTDGGALDGDTARDRAVGPMQFIPSTWRTYAADGNGDGRADIDNIYDEALAAGRYLCVAAAELTLRTREGVVRAILAYNPNQDYLRVVGARYEALAQDAASGWFSVADLPTPSPGDAVPASGVTGGTPPPSEAPAAPAAPTVVRPVRVFGPDAVLLAALPGDPAPGRCAEASSVLLGRPGWVRCTLGPASGAGAVLDPCLPAPYDPTLVACVADPEQPVRLVRTPAPTPAAAPAAGPPHQVIVLAGGDRCRPLARTASTTTATPDTSSTTAPGGAGRSAPRTASTTSSSTAPSSTAGTGASSAASTTTTGASTTSKPTTATTSGSGGSTTAAGTTAATTTSSTRATGSSTTAASTTTAATAPATSTTLAPVPDTGTTYRCASGAELDGQPDRTTPVWKVVVRQPGIAARTVAVATVLD